MPECDGVQSCDSLLAKSSESLALRIDDIQGDIVSFGQANRVVATISKDGVFRFKVEANDENTREFVRMFEEFISGRKITAVEAEVVEGSGQS